MRNLDKSDRDLDQNELGKRCALLMLDCDTEIRSTMLRIH
jgi:hypothetical protein